MLNLVQPLQNFFQLDVNILDVFNLRIVQGDELFLVVSSNDAAEFGKVWILLGNPVMANFKLVIGALLLMLWGVVGLAPSCLQTVHELLKLVGGLVVNVEALVELGFAVVQIEVAVDHTDLVEEEVVAVSRRDADGVARVRSRGDLLKLQTGSKVALKGVNDLWILVDEGLVDFNDVHLRFLNLYL